MRKAMTELAVYLMVEAETKPINSYRIFNILEGRGHRSNYINLGISELTRKGIIISIKQNVMQHCGSGSIQVNFLKLQPLEGLK